MKSDDDQLATRLKTDSPLLAATRTRHRHDTPALGPVQSDADSKYVAVHLLHNVRPFLALIWHSPAWFCLTRSLKDLHGSPPDARAYPVFWRLGPLQFGRNAYPQASRSPSFQPQRFPNGTCDHEIALVRTLRV